jgi:hypothetical protein
MVACCLNSLILETGNVVTASGCLFFIIYSVGGYSFCIVPTFVVVVPKLCAVSGTKEEEEMLAFTKKNQSKSSHTSENTDT